MVAVGSKSKEERERGAQALAEIGCSHFGDQWNNCEVSTPSSSQC